MGTAQATFTEMVRGGATGSDVSHVTGSDVSHVTGSDVSHVTGNDITGSVTERKWHHRNRKWLCMHNRFPRFFSCYFISSTVVLLHMTDMATGSHPKGFSCLCACPTWCCAIFALVGSFDRKWRYEASPVVTKGHLTPKAVEGSAHAKPEAA
jgi:hypothetical protein